MISTIKSLLLFRCAAAIHKRMAVKKIQKGKVLSKLLRTAFILNIWYSDL